MTTVLKLGGSAITEKDEPETLDEDALSTAATVLAESVSTSDRLVVVHGGGSFGHHHAASHGVTETEGTHDADAVLDIHRAMGRLNEAVVDELSDACLAAVPIRPLSTASRAEDGTLSLPAGQVETMLEEGFVPVIHGDVVAHAGEGATILSGDSIVVSLARSLAADRVGLCSTVPGVLEEDDTVIETIDSYEAVASLLGGSESTDVTGGMAGKVRRLLDLDAPASIFDLDALAEFLDTGTAGTVVR
jgi:isopentenyl phosphate kinase